MNFQNLKKRAEDLLKEYSVEDLKKAWQGCVENPEGEKHFIEGCEAVFYHLKTISESVDLDYKNISPHMVSKCSGALGELQKIFNGMQDLKDLDSNRRKSQGNSYLQDLLSDRINPIYDVGNALRTSMSQSDEVIRLRAELKELRENSGAKISEVNRVVESLGTKSVSEGPEKFYNKAAWVNRVSGVILNVCTLVSVSVICYFLYNEYTVLFSEVLKPDIDHKTFLLSGAWWFKIFMVSYAMYGINILNKLAGAFHHTATIYKRASLGFKTLSKIPSELPEGTYRDSVAGELVNSIFANTSTGFSKSEGGYPFSNPIQKFLFKDSRNKE